jgi:hypothetical protein
MGTEKSPLFFLTYEHASLEFLYGEKTSRSRQSNFIFLKLFGSLITLLENRSIYLSKILPTLGKGKARLVGLAPLKPE